MDSEENAFVSLQIPAIGGRQYAGDQASAQGIGLPQFTIQIALL